MCLFNFDATVMQIFFHQFYYKTFAICIEFTVYHGGGEEGDPPFEQNPFCSKITPPSPPQKLHIM